jgi:hypothetical protein
MLKIEEIGPRALAVMAEGETDKADVTRALAAAKDLRERVGGDIDMLADVRDTARVTLAAIGAELANLPEVISLAQGLRRVAVIADEGWMRTAAKVEAKLLWSIDYRVFEREEEEAARAWVLG